MYKAEEDPDAYLPALPPDLLAERQRKKAAKLEQNVDSQHNGAAKLKRRPFGPALPNPTEYLNFDEEEEEEIVIGPVLPENFEKDKDDLILQQTIQEFEERAEKMRQTSEPDNKADKPLQRGEWMLVPRFQ